MTSEWALYLLISLAIFTLSFRFLARLQADYQALVARINVQEELSFDAAHLLGYPAPAFLVFDRRHRKLALCSVVLRVLSLGSIRELPPKVRLPKINWSRFHDRIL